MGVLRFDSRLCTFEVLYPDTVICGTWSFIKFRFHVKSATLDGLRVRCFFTDVVNDSPRETQGIYIHVTEKSVDGAKLYSGVLTAKRPRACSYIYVSNRRLVGGVAFSFGASVHDPEVGKTYEVELPTLFVDTGVYRFLARFACDRGPLHDGFFEFSVKSIEYEEAVVRRYRLYTGLPIAIAAATSAVLLSRR